MTKNFFLIIIAIIFTSCDTLQTSVSQSKDNELTLLSYNIRNAWGMDHVTDYDRVAKIITRLQPDAVALQELDSATVRSYGVVVIDELAKRTGMYATYSRSINYQGGGYGIGILTKEKPLRTRRIPLPGNEEKRSLLMVEMSKYIFCCTHWSLTQNDRVQSVKIINDFVAQLHTNKPIFLAGDLNAVSSSTEMAELTKDWNILNDTQQFTIPSSVPIKCIDYILVHRSSSEVIPLMSKVENEPLASDHLPVWIKVRMSQQISIKIK